MDPEKFAKVLALADSDHQGEAQSALRAARIMLARVGLTFRDLALIARRGYGGLGPAAPEPPPPPSVSVVSADDEQQRRHVAALEARIEELEFALTRQRAELARQRQDAKRWHKLAQDTAERLWDIGKVLETRRTNHAVPDKRRTLIDLLRDPAAAGWSNREVARRTGMSIHAVAYWRWRLAVTDRQQRLSKALPRSRRLYARDDRPRLRRT
jgi:DNA-binding transcriptional MerR regulator